MIAFAVFMLIRNIYNIIDMIDVWYKLQCNFSPMEQHSCGKSPPFVWNDAKLCRRISLVVGIRLFGGTSPVKLIRQVTGRFAHFPVRPESFRPESFHPRVVSPSITWVVSPSYPESFRPLFDESFRPLSEFIFYWGYCDKFTDFVSFNEDFGYISLKNDMSFINWSKWYIYLYSV